VAGQSGPSTYPAGWLRRKSLLANCSRGRSLRCCPDWSRVDPVPKYPHPRIWWCGHCKRRQIPASSPGRPALAPVAWGGQARGRRPPTDGRWQSHRGAPGGQERTTAAPAPRLNTTDPLSAALQPPALAAGDHLPLPGKAAQMSGRPAATAQWHSSPPASGRKRCVGGQGKASQAKWPPRAAGFKCHLAEAPSRLP